MIIKNIKLTNFRNYDNLDLELNSKTQVFKSKQGVNFCGYKINEYRLKIRDRGKKKLKKKIVSLKMQIKKRKIEYFLRKKEKLLLSMRLGMHWLQGF